MMMGGRERKKNETQIRLVVPMGGLAQSRLVINENLWLFESGEARTGGGGVVPEQGSSFFNILGAKY